MSLAYLRHTHVSTTGVRNYKWNDVNTKGVMWGQSSTPSTLTSLRCLQTLTSHFLLLLLLFPRSNFSHSSAAEISGAENWPATSKQALCVILSGNPPYLSSQADTNKCSASLESSVKTPSPNKKNNPEIWLYPP